MKLLNVGCGATFHLDWVNLDIVASHPAVIACDLRQGIPHQDESCDAVYVSHVLEHLTPAEAQSLVGEAARVLKPRGTLRVVVPDLETIAKLYLEKLEGALAGDREAARDHAWMTIELLDQAVRSGFGGSMATYLRQEPVPNLPFVRSRIGHEAEACLRSMEAPSRPRGRLERWVSQRPAGALRRIRIFLAERAVGMVMGRQGREWFREGWYRNQGEVHRWMYDRFSLATLLAEMGLHEIRVCAPAESRIPDFPRYGLEVDGGGVRKPDSLFMEGTKPARSSSNGVRRPSS